MATLNGSSRLLRLRTLLGLTQRELAKEFGVSCGAIGFWEKGSRPIPGPVLKLMELHESYFVSPSAPKTPDPFNQNLSAQWARTIVEKSGIRSHKVKQELKQNLENSISGYLSSGISQNEIERKIQISITKKLVSSLSEAKGIPLKAAQLASYLDFNIPDELREALLALQTHVEPMSPERSARVIYEELGKRPEKLFKEWSPRPFAAASIGQVHRARLLSGEEVAVKVQYPDLLKSLKRDLGDLSFFHHLALLLRGVNSEVIDTFKEAIVNECDYAEELKNQEKLGVVFKNDQSVVIPRVFPEFSGRRVLTTQFVRGLSFQEFLAKGSKVQKDKAGETIVRFYTYSGFKHGVFQGDPNPGNYLFCGDRVAFVDFGRVVHWNDFTRTRERDLLASVVKNDPREGQRCLEELGLIDSMDQQKFMEFWEFFSAQHTPLVVDQPFEYSRDLIRQRIVAAQGYKNNPMTRVTPTLFWDIFLSMSANAIRGDLGSRANWHKQMLGILKESGANV